MKNKLVGFASSVVWKAQIVFHRVSIQRIRTSAGSRFQVEKFVELIILGYCRER